MPGNDNYTKGQVGIQGAYSIDSKHITNQFINTYRKGGYISVPMKDRVLDKLDDNNKFGGEGTVKIYYRSQADSISGRGWFAGLSHTGIVDARFTRDLFHLYFYGNKPFAGRTADLGELRYRQLEYQQLQAGLYMQSEKEGLRSTYGIGLGYVNGQDYVEVKTGSSQLFTAADATYLTMDLSLEARHADSAKHSLGSFNGSGAALSLFYQLEKKDKYIFTVRLQDAGFISWNSKTTFAEVDTSYFFDGIEVTNLLDSLYLEVKSVEEYKNGFLKQNKSESNTSVLPALAEISMEKWFSNKRLLGGIHVRYRAATMQLPIFTAKATWLSPQGWFTGLSVQYGGYGGVHAGIEAGVLINKRWLIHAGSNYIDGFLTAKTRGGQGGFVKLAAAF